jgi:hypothetical protein
MLAIDSCLEEYVQNMKQNIWIITCYSNPLGYRTRRENFSLFASSLAQQGANLLIVEMAEPDGKFDLNQQEYNCIRVRGDCLIWQKERMLNLALRHLPAECKYVVWADCDIIFELSDWLPLTARALEHDVVVQPFEHSVRLPYGHVKYTGESQENSGIVNSFGSLYKRDSSLARHGKYHQHGHTGYVWAAQRDFLDACDGLYDTCMTGSSDHLMAHAFASGLQSPCIPRMLAQANTFGSHFARWAEKVDAICQGRLGYVPGTVLHLWHGTLGNRRYDQRNREFGKFDFDPDRDLRVDESGLWAWSDTANHLRLWSQEYFKSRKEDEIEPQSAHI